MSLEKNIVMSMVLLGLLLLHSNKASATNYTVGDSKGWTFGVTGWENGKSFKAGDTLVFNYNPSFHNVIAVDKASYDSCTVPSGAKPFTSGKDQITLAKGANYFICGKDGHCQGGVKIAAIAA